jgi:hypothetical protein
MVLTVAEKLVVQGLKRDQRSCPSQHSVRRRRRNPPGDRGAGLAAEILTTMGAIAARHGLTHMIAPVRPTWKDRHPATPIERLGARMGPAAPAWYRIDGTVKEWESWLEMALQESGDYVFQGGLSPLAVHRESDRAIYLEPNVWMIHNLSSLTNY